MATNAEKLDEILETVQRLEVANATRDANQRNMQSCLNAVYASVKGNGKNGLEKDVAMVKANIKLVNWVGAVVAGAVLMDAVTRIIALVH
jgi:hypothetical protein